MHYATPWVTLTAALLLLASTAGASASAPVGLWTQQDQASGTPESSVVSITRLPDGTLQGVVEKVLASRDGKNPRCNRCTGSRQGKPFVGMVVIWGVQRHGNRWDGGRILDPLNGKTYKVRLTPVDGGRKLKIRAYLGIPWLGRTQVWVRRGG